MYPGCTARADYQCQPDFGIYPDPEVWLFCAVHVLTGMESALVHQERRGDPYISVIIERARPYRHRSII